MRAAQIMYNKHRPREISRIVEIAGVCNYDMISFVKDCTLSKILCASLEN